MSEFNFLSKIIYTLKRQFPATIKVIKKNKAVVNFTTGKVENSETELEVERAVVLPKTLVHIDAGLKLQLGESERSILIDFDDISFSVDNEDKVIFEETTWEVTETYNHADRILEVKVKHV